MTATTMHFKVDNGDMTLIALESGRYILIDCKIRCAADDPDDSTPDVGAQLKDRLPRDDAGRPYVDAFVLTHPDQDHCGGLRTHFHLGDPSKWNTDGDKIIIREMWSSPIVFRRADKKCPLCDDAKAWAQEARRRVKLFRSQSYSADGDRILILGEDIDGKTDDLGAILVPAGSRFSIICGAVDASFEALLLAPLLADDEEEDEVLSKNNSSVILRRVVAPLSSAFARVTWVDTTSFMKTIHRKRATRSGNGKLVWMDEPTAPGQSLHELLAHNVDEGRAHFALGAAA